MIAVDNEPTQTPEQREARIRAYEERYRTTCCRKCGSEIDSSGWCANYCMDDE